MPLVKLCIRLGFQLIVCLLTRALVTGQAYVYTDRELLFDASKDQMRVMLSPDGHMHVWRLGANRVTLDVYDKQLHLVQNQTVSRRCERMLFTAFKNFYYVLLMEQKSSRMFCVKNNSLTDKTADFSKIPLEEMPVAQIRQGKQQLLFIQYSPAQDEEHSMMHVTAIDSNLQYINSMHLTLRYTAAQLRNLWLQTLGDDLLIVNRAVNDSGAKLTIHKLNVSRGTVRSNSVLFKNELFIPQDVLPYKTGFVLQGQANKPLGVSRIQTAYTYLLQIDSNLQITGRFHTALNDSSLMANTMYLYLPVSTTVLPNNHMLITDYLRNLNLKSRTFEVRLRYNQLDSSMAPVNSMVLRTNDYSNYPSLVFTSGNRVMVYYEEAIKSSTMVVHSFRYGEGGDTDRILQLNPKNHYLLKSAIRTGDASFVMPYLRNYKLGLVRVTVPDAE